MAAEGSLSAWAPDTHTGDPRALNPGSWFGLEAILGSELGWKISYCLPLHSSAFQMDMSFFKIYFIWILNYVVQMDKSYQKKKKRKKRSNH